MLAELRGCRELRIGKPPQLGERRRREQLPRGERRRLAFKKLNPPRHQLLGRLVAPRGDRGGVLRAAEIGQVVAQALEAAPRGVIQHVVVALDQQRAEAVVDDLQPQQLGSRRVEHFELRVEPRRNGVLAQAASCRTRGSC